MKVKNVSPLDDFKRSLLFDSGEVRVFDVTPYLDKGIFKELKNGIYFKQVRPFFGGAGWSHGQDLSADTLYLESTASPEVTV